MSGAGRLVSIDAKFIAPSGKQFSPPGRAKGNRFNSRWPIAADEARRPGELWRLEVVSTIRSKDSVNLQSISEVALDVFEPTASLQSIAGGEQSMSMNLDVIQPGRHEARALVYDTDYDGTSKPAMLAYQAQWLSPGQQPLDMNIDLTQLQAQGVAAPFVVKRLRFLDQGRMAVLQTHIGEWPLE